MVYSTWLALSIAGLLSATSQGYVIQMRDHKGNLKEHAHHHNLTAEEFLKNKEPVIYHREVKVDDRAVIPCITEASHGYSINGDGDPHQNYKIAQIANTLIECPGTVATGESHTFGWSIGGGFNPGSEAWDFASLSFSVSESDTKSVTDSFSCDGGMTEICAMHFTAVTAVSVTFHTTTTSCAGTHTVNDGTGVVYLPNSNGIGSFVSRGTNFGDRNIIQCRGQSAREVDFYCGPKGGPEWFNTQQYGPFGANYMAQLDPPGCAVPIEAQKFA